MEAGWVRPAGRREVPGRPLLFATTTEFLSHFGLGSRRDLPGIEDLKAAGLLDPADLELDVLTEQSALENGRSEEHTSELQSLMRNSYAVFCLKKQKIIKVRRHTTK